MWMKRLTIFAVLLACCVVVLGAYTRLKDAGLGCPDWPGCYGHLSVPQTVEAIERANNIYPERPVEPHKAWPEMIHRYFASSLGLTIIAIVVLAFRQRKVVPTTPLKLPLALLALVIFQGLLGMWTVTLGLFPTVVMAHLLGGFTTLCLLFLLALRLHQPEPVSAARPSPMFKWGIAGMAIVALQIALGGWTAANYAATVCRDLPICQAGWSQHVNFQDAFQFWGHGVDDYEYATHIGPDAKITIHVTHRIGAIITTLYLTAFFVWLWCRPDINRKIKQVAALTAGILCLQVGLGISNVVFELPLLIAVAHNGVAALLLTSLIILNFSLYRTGRTAQ